MTGFIHRCSDKEPRPSGAHTVRPEFASGYFAQDAADRCARLTPRQREVLTLLCKGMRQQPIADLLGISRDVVHEHHKKALVALDVATGAEAAVLATKAGWV